MGGESLPIKRSFYAKFCACIALKFGRGSIPKMRLYSLQNLGEDSKCLLMKGLP